MPETMIPNMFNPLKTLCMIFRPKPFSNTNVENLKLGDTTFKFDKEVVYLDHHICDNLKDDWDIKRLLRKLNTVGNVILRKFGMCTPEVERHLFGGHCSAVYCS